jgi:hypothetical protein
MATEARIRYKRIKKSGRRRQVLHRPTKAEMKNIGRKKVKTEADELQDLKLFKKFPI